MAEHLELDELDKQILAKLVDDGKMAYTDIAKLLAVSSGTIHVRMRKMEQMGLVKGSSLVLDYSKLGYDLTAFVGVYLLEAAHFETTCKALEDVAEVVEAHSVTGPFQLLVRIICKDRAHLRMVLREKIDKLPGVHRTDTMLSLEQCFERTVNFWAENGAGQ